MLGKVGVGLGLLATMASAASVADAQTYVYNRGKNYVEVPGSRCVAASAGQQAGVARSDGQLTLLSGAPLSQTFFCPINRRSLHYYGVDTGANLMTVSAQRISVRVQDADPGRTFSCTPFSKTNLGSVVFGQTRFACSTFQGCTADPGGSFVGNQLLNFSNFSATNTVQWGVSCAIPPGSTLHYIEAVVNPNAG